MMPPVRFQGVTRIYAPNHKRLMEEADKVDQRLLDKPALLSYQQVNYTHPKNKTLVSGGLVGRMLTGDDALKVLADFGVQISPDEDKASAESKIGAWMESWKTDSKYEERLEAYDRAIAAYTLYQEAIKPGSVEDIYVPKRKPKTPVQA